jgi:hypothetical protein
MTNADSASPTLSFEFLEDVLNLPRSKHEVLVSRATVDQIGPLVEYAYHDIGNASARLASVSDSSVVKALSYALRLECIAQAKQGLRIDAHEQHEFMRTPQNDDEVEDSKWLAFARRLGDAGVKAGLSKGFSQALAGTFGEMASNILQHSDNCASGLAGYRWTPGKFEYVAVDSGIGVLNSLRKHTDYGWIVDSGQALELAIRDGESEYGRAAHKGTGFHALTTNIALRNSILRFRSGDHSYTIDGTRIPILTKIQSCPMFSGFLISITSTAPSGLTTAE